MEKYDSNVRGKGQKSHSLKGNYTIIGLKGREEFSTVLSGKKIITCHN